MAGESDHKYMALALEQAKKCVPTSTAYCVGAVLVVPSAAGDQILATGYSRELPGNTHAEQCCFEKYAGDGAAPARAIPASAVLYTTMEPCVERLSGNLPCVDRILQYGVQTVKVGVLEPNTFVKDNDSLKRLQAHGVRYEQVPGFADKCLEVARRGH
ncbi:cytidine deaminase-like protein [Dipodascopsis tothii]|uniref:cytidine deaminase-like protein n=1 Tax=Dipodascopsis tothii TaxID=44089 RepID=UPI0034CD2069